MEVEKSSDKSVYVELNNLPATISNDELNRICATFGTVTMIARSLTDKSCARIEYADRRWT